MKGIKILGLVACTYVGIAFFISSFAHFANGRADNGILSIILGLIALIPVIIKIVKAIKQKTKKLKENTATIVEVPGGWKQPSPLKNGEQYEEQQYKKELKRLTTENADLKKRIQQLEESMSPENHEHVQLLQDIQTHKDELESLNQEIQEKKAESEEEEKSLINITKRTATAQRKLHQLYDVQRGMQNAAQRYFATETFDRSIIYPYDNNDVEELLLPTVSLHLHALDIRELRKRFKQNQKLIDETLKKYEGRYQSKGNQTIYQLMVIALRAELQNILYNLKYDKLDTAIENVKTVTQKYFGLASKGNQSIAPTLARFIGEIEFLFIQAVQIEYEYYVQRERIREEQRALREQMRQEAAERKLLEQQQRQVEKEEAKFKQEMSSVADQLAETSADDPRTVELKKRLAELEQQLIAVGNKKEEISRLQHGKAGYVYVISNLGSFGDHVFKIGMTRRLNPQERIDELGSASVPFPFDVHSLIFSEDAPSLENSIHKRLNDHRVNKVNLRKEFFDITLGELEQLVYELQPTAEFKQTMLAEQYHQSLSQDTVYETYAEECEEIDSEDFLED